jgi:hypothetical protein
MKSVLVQSHHRENVIVFTHTIKHGTISNVMV